MPKIKWPNKPTKTTMNSFYRFGLLSTKRPHNGRNWLCLACRQEFIEHQNALIHPCEKEQEFRLYSKRYI